MHELYDLKRMLCDELKEFAKKGELSAGSLTTIDTLAHAVKNLDKIIENYDSEYSGRSYRYDDGYRGRSYARRRDSMGRYSLDDGFADELRELLKDAPDETVRQKLQKLIDHVEQ